MSAKLVNMIGDLKTVQALLAGARAYLEIAWATQTALKIDVETD